MKWLKLDCDFRNDPKIRGLAQQFGGLEACGFWTLLLTYIGAHGMPDCAIELSPTGAHTPILLASFCCTKPKVLLSMLDSSAVLGLINAECWRNDRVISIPNMLKRVDDYSRKVRTRSEQCPELPAIEQKKKKIIEVEQNRTDTEKKSVHGEFGHVQLTADQYSKLDNKLNGSLKTYIDRFDRWAEEQPRKAKGRQAYLSILNWFERDQKEKPGLFKAGNGEGKYRSPGTEAAREWLKGRLAQNDNETKAN